MTDQFALAALWLALAPAAPLLPIRLGNTTALPETFTGPSRSFSPGS